MNAAVNHPSAPFASDPPDLEPAIRIRGMDANADHVAGLNVFRIERLQGFVGDDRIAVLDAGCRGKHIQPGEA